MSAIAAFATAIRNITMRTPKSTLKLTRQVFLILRSIRLYVYHDKYSSYGPRKDCDNALTDCLAPYFFPLSFSPIILYEYWLLRIVNLLKLGSQPQLVPWTIQGTRSSFPFPPYFPFFIAQTPNTKRFQILLYNEGYKQFHYLCRRGLTGQFR
jgi:hypothetical protein